VYLYYGNKRVGKRCIDDECRRLQLLQGWQGKYSPGLFFYTVVVVADAVATAIIY